MTRRLSPAAALVAGAFLVTALTVAANRDLFSSPVIESTDFAVNALQVQEAKAGRELLGNYSRFRFHHPGPFFFYVMAAGERVFYDAARVVPAPFNAEILAIILLNGLLFGAALFVCLRHFRSAVFVPLAIGMAVWFFYTVNVTSIQAAALHGAMASPWVPHLLLAPFVLLLVSGASVAGGEAGHLPLAVLATAILVHGHVAQAMIAPVVLVSGVAALAFRHRRTLRGLVSRNRAPLYASAAIAALFAAPILIEVALHEPDNVDAIRAYRARAASSDPKPTLSKAVVYFATFIVHAPSPETTVLQAHPDLFRIAWSRPYARNFLLGQLLLALLAIVLCRRAPPEARRFGASLAGGVLLTAILFLLWSLNITGEFYQFNGFFVFSLQLVVGVASAGILASWLEPRIRVPLPAVLLATCAAAAGIWLTQEHFRHHIAGEPRARAIATALPPNIGIIRLEIDWDGAAGVASWMKREGRPFCVGPEWAFAYGKKNVCRETPPFTLSMMGNAPLPAFASPRVIYDAGGDRAILTRPATVRPPTLGLSVQERVPLQVSTHGVTPMGNGRYLLQSPDGVEVSLIESAIPLTRGARYLVEFTGRSSGSMEKPILVNLYAGPYLREGRSPAPLSASTEWRWTIIDAGPDAPEKAAVRVYTQSTVPVEIGDVAVSILKPGK